jgi:hypothetical protein
VGQPIGVEGGLIVRLLLLASLGIGVERVLIVRLLLLASLGIGVELS